MWNEKNRFNQSGYSAPTVFPEAKNYQNLKIFMADMVFAVQREESRREWLEEQLYEYRLEEAERREEAKLERELLESGIY